MFNFLRRNPAEHLKRADALLREAHLARIEHEAAAEHHAALAGMYAHRVQRLEREIHAARGANSTARPVSDANAVDRDAANARLYPITPAESAEKRLQLRDAAGFAPSEPITKFRRARMSLRHASAVERP